MGLTIVLAHLAWRRTVKWDIFLKDTVISLLILILILEPATSFQDAIPNILAVIASVGIRALIRMKGLPVLNPAAGGILLVTLLAYSGLITAPFASWWGANYGVSALGYSLPVGTVISAALAVLVIFRIKKWFYALAFFIPFVLGFGMLNGWDTLISTLLDGTIYFFFGVMACDPKTAPATRPHQLITGVALAVFTLVCLRYNVPGGYVAAIVLANILTLGLKQTSSMQKIQTS